MPGTRAAHPHRRSSRGTMTGVIDPRLEQLLTSEADAAVNDSSSRATDTSKDTAPESASSGQDATDEPNKAAAGDPTEAERRRNELLDLAAAGDPNMAPIAEAAKADIRVGADGKIVASDALKAAMRALVPGRDKAPTDTAYRTIGGWLSADNTALAPVTGPSPCFTVSHWHWMAAHSMVRQMPTELGPTFPHLMTSEAQIMHDLTAWGALDERGEVTAEAQEMFGAVTGHAPLTVFGTVLLYAQRRAPAQLPAELTGFGLEAAVRNVPRVTFVVGIGDREVVTALVNNTSVAFTRRLRRGGADTDAAEAVRALLDPDDQWPAFPLKAPVVLPGDVVQELASDPTTGTLIDTEPGPDADEDTRARDAALRQRTKKATRSVLQAAKTPTTAQTLIADIASSTTHALAQITVSTCDVDVSRGEAGAMAIVFLRNRGVVVSYPSGSGSLRRITYAAGNISGIRSGIGTLRSAYRGG